MPNMLTPTDLQAIGQLMDEKIQPVHTRLDRVDPRFDQVDTRLDGMDARFDRMDGRIDRVETGLTALILGVEHRLDAKIDGLEWKLEAKIDTLTSHVDGFAQRQLMFEAELAANRAARGRLEARLPAA